MDGWKEFSGRIISELDRLHNQMGTLENELKEINQSLNRDKLEKEKRLTRVEVKSGWYGAVGGALVTISTLGIMFLKGKF